MYTQWEFVRRFMENGPEKLVYQVDTIHHIYNKRETYMRGLYCIFASFWSEKFLLLPLLPLLLLSTIGRVIVMHTSKIPVWPKEIEEECAFPIDDPYIRDEFHLAPPGIAFPPGWGGKQEHDDDYLKQDTPHNKDDFLD
jgi:hypothetical protein